jgi:hypothetical protein
MGSRPMLTFIFIFEYGTLSFVYRMKVLMLKSHILVKNTFNTIFINFVSRLETLYTRNHSGRPLKKPFKYHKGPLRQYNYVNRNCDLTINDRLINITSLVLEEIQRFDLSDRMLLRSSKSRYHREQARRKALKKQFKVYCICPVCVEHYQYYFQVSTPSRILKRI